MLFCACAFLFFNLAPLLRCTRPDSACAFLCLCFSVLRFSALLKASCPLAILALVSSRLMLVLAFVSINFGGGGGIIPVRVCYASSLPPFILIMSFSLLGSDVVSFCARFLLRPLSYKFIMVQLYYYV